MANLLYGPDFQFTILIISFEQVKFGVAVGHIFIQSSQDANRRHQ
jgi:hypothetical protein